MCPPLNLHDTLISMNDPLNKFKLLVAAQILNVVYGAIHILRLLRAQFFILNVDTRSRTQIASDGVAKPIRWLEKGRGSNFSARFWMRNVNGA